jgi:hypothetical protein
MNRNKFVLTEYISALIWIFDKLDSLNIKWAITGSMSHKVQGVNVLPRDIDIITTQCGAKKISILLDIYSIKVLKYRESERIRSYFSVFEYKNIEFDVFAEIENKVSDTFKMYHNYWEQNIIKIEINDRDIPFLALEYDMEVYKNLNMGKRVLLINDVISN